MCRMSENALTNLKLKIQHDWSEDKRPQFSAFFTSTYQKRPHTPDSSHHICCLCSAGWWVMMGSLLVQCWLRHAWAPLNISVRWGFIAHTVPGVNVHTVQQLVSLLSHHKKLCIIIWGNLISCHMRESNLANNNWVQWIQHNKEKHQLGGKIQWWYTPTDRRQ